MTTEDAGIETDALREEAREKYRIVAADPTAQFHVETGRPLAAKLGYDREIVEPLPERAVESFASVSNPFSLRPLRLGERVSTLAAAQASTHSSRPARWEPRVRSSAST